MTRLLSFLLDGELDIVGALGQLLIVRVESFDLARVRPRLQRFIEDERCIFDALVDVIVHCLGPARRVRVDAELVVRRIGIGLPLDFNSLGGDFGTGLRTDEFQIVLEKIRIRCEISFVRFDVVLGRGNNSRRGEDVIRCVENFDGKTFVNAWRHILNKIFAIVVGLGRESFAAASAKELVECLTKFDVDTGRRLFIEEGFALDIAFSGLGLLFLGTRSRRYRAVLIRLSLIRIVRFGCCVRVGNGVAVGRTVAYKFFRGAAAEQKSDGKN